MRTASWPELTGPGVASARQATALLAEPAVAERWEDPSSLPAMTVGALAGHLGLMITSLAGWLDAEEPDAATVEVRSVVDSYGRTARLDPTGGLEGKAATAIRTRAAQAAADGPAAVAQRVGAAADRLPGMLAAASPDRLIPGAILTGTALRLGDYLRTRCVELVVHLDDLAVSVGLTVPEPDPGSAAVGVELLVELCRARSGDADVVRALARPNRAGPDVLRAL